MADPLQALLEHLADYVIDDEARALDAACAMAARVSVDVAALLAGLDALIARRADPARLQQARVRLRAALRLPLIPGPVCRVES